MRFSLLHEHRSINVVDMSMRVRFMVSGENVVIGLMTLILCSLILFSWLYPLRALLSQRLWLLVS